MNYSKSILKYLVYFFFLIKSTFLFSQSKYITGIVSDENSKPLESANIIAKPLQEKASLKFAIADNKKMT